MAGNDIPGYVDTVLREAEQRRNYLHEEKVSTVYIGGGTPSVLEVREIKHLLDGLISLFIIDGDAEITIELNPDDITPDYINDLKNTRVNRLSIGIQSWRDQDLKMMNRRHNFVQAEKSNYRFH